MLTLTGPDYGMPAAQALKTAAENLQYLLHTRLRKGDVVCAWNEAQFLVMMPDLNLEQAEKALGRITKQFAEEFGTRDVIIRSNLQSILPTEAYLSG